MKSIFLAKIRELGIKKVVFLSIFGLVALAYIATPLIALACPGANNGGGQASSSDNNNNNNNNNGNNNNGNNNNNNGNNNGNNNNNNGNNNGNNNNNNGNNTTKRSARRQSAQANSGISLTINSQNFLVNRIACVRILNFSTKQPITFKDFQALSQYAQTQGKSFQVQTQLVSQSQSQVCNNQPINQKFQPLATSLATFSIQNPTGNLSQSFGILTIKTDNQQTTIIGDPTLPKLSVVSPTSINIPLRFSDSDPLLSNLTNGSRR